jgi:hypothetical protein
MRLPFLQIPQLDMSRGRTLARILRIPEAHGIGLTVALDAWAVEEAPEGDVSGLIRDPNPAEAVALVVGWDGDSGALLAALERVRLVEDMGEGPAVVSVRRYAAQQDLAWPRRVRPKPGVLEWAARHPGVPMPDGVELDVPVVRLLTPEEQAQRRAECEERTRQCRAEAEERRRLKARRWVYFVQGVAGGPIKIGISRDVERRRTELQRVERQPLRVLATIEGTMADESALHARFVAHRLRGEWFSPAPELLSHIAALNGVKA